MKKYEGIDIISALKIIVDNNTKHYKSDFKYDIKMFKDAVDHQDGENNRFLWLSRQSGTECFTERNVYLKETCANTTWLYHADRKDENLIAFAVEVTGIKDKRVVGNIYELNYKQHAAEVKRNSLPCVSVTLTYKDGTEKQVLYSDYLCRQDQLRNEHGGIKQIRLEPEYIDDLQTILYHTRKKRNSHTATFKARTPKQLSIKQKLEAGKKQLEQQRAATQKQNKVMAVAAEV